MNLTAGVCALTRRETRAFSSIPTRIQSTTRDSPKRHAALAATACEPLTPTL